MLVSAEGHDVFGQARRAASLLRPGALDATVDVDVLVHEAVRTESGERACAAETGAVLTLAGIAEQRLQRFRERGTVVRRNENRGAVPELPVRHAGGRRRRR